MWSINKVVGGSKNNVKIYICRAICNSGDNTSKLYENNSLSGSERNLSNFEYYDSNKTFTWSANNTNQVLGWIDNYNKTDCT
jgi:hypothetical protein